MKNHTRETWIIYRNFLAEHKPSIFFTVIFVLGGTVTNTVIPIYFKNFFDALSSNIRGNNEITRNLLHILTIIAFIELLRWTFWRLSIIVMNRFQPTIIAKLSNYCFSELHKHSFSYFNNNFVGSLVKRVSWFTRAFENISDIIIWNVIPLITSMLIVIVVLAKRNFFLGLGVIIYLLIFLTTNWFLTTYKIKYDIKRSEAETKASAILADTITNNQNVKLFGGYEREVVTFKNAVDVVKKLRIFTWNLDAVFDGIQGFLTMVLEIGIIFLSISLWNKNLLTIGDFVLIQAYLISIFNQTWGFGKMIRNLYTNLADAEEMTILLNTPIEITDHINAGELVVSSGMIKFSDVGFNYNETRKIIENFNLTIKSKEKIALVGSSGSGKTTITKILLRMYDLTSGEITIDEQDISKVKQESLWKNISLVPQEPILFHRTLLENIRYGRPESSDDEVIKAAQIAHCHEFISTLPEGYNTFVGERGIKLSGGERQRVAIARAILRNAPILILDEATSSLDSESEALIRDALDSLMKNKTVIVIAHRLSTIMKMDRIVVLDKGEIKEEGTHEELLKVQSSIYSKLWKIQAGGFLVDDGSEVDIEKS